MENTTIVRHGDVILRPVSSTEGQEVKHKGMYQLAFGEVTGHSHRLTVKNPANMKVYQMGEKLFVCLMEVGELTHEEHATVEVPVGTYERTMEREYDYALESMRKVVD